MTPDTGEREDVEAVAEAIFNIREQRNFPPDGRFSWIKAPSTTRNYCCEMARAAIAVLKARGWRKT